MKYIEYSELSRLARALTVDGPDCSVHTKLEAYSCKNIKRDKKLFKSLESAYNDDLSAMHSHSPPSFPDGSSILDGGGEMTPFGPIDKHASRKTLYLLIATLNIAFPDYEFSDVRPHHFNKEQSGASVLNALSTTLISPHRAGARAPRTYSSYPTSTNEFFPAAWPTSSSPLHSILASPYAPPPIVAGTHPTLYRLIDEVIGLSESEVFSYVPDIESDPHASEFSDDEDDFAELGDGNSSSDDEPTFEFDNYDIDEVHPTSSHQYSGNSPSLVIPPKRTWSYSSSSTSSPTSPLSYVRPYPHTTPKRRRGALLWSSHWFFLNRKLKRILFISIWAKTKGMERSWSGETGALDADGLDLEDGYGTFGSAPSSEKFSSERFLGWDGGVGAGARAMGLSASV